MSNENDYNNEVEIQWCPGCPNFAILRALKRVLAFLDVAPENLCLVSGIGQAAKLPHYLKCNFFNGLHGRALPVALGIQSANPELTTIVTTGDGDCYGEGGNHFIHTVRRNPNMTLFVHNNEIYALTKGQASPTTPTGEKRTIQVKGVDVFPLNTLAIALLHDCGFIARGFAGDMAQLETIMAEAIKYPGFAYVDIIQPCITWGTRSVAWYRERIHRLADDYDPSDKSAAMDVVTRREENISTGIIYKGIPKPVFGDRFRNSVSTLPLGQLNPVGDDTIQQLLSELYWNI